jgi:hypothetical protein
VLLKKQNANKAMSRNLYTEIYQKCFKKQNINQAIFTSQKVVAVKGIDGRQQRKKMV